MFVAIYELCPKPGQEAAFAAAWAEFTRQIYRHCGSRGSRLHATGDPGRTIAYAQWPSRAAWEAASSDDADFLAARDAMFATLASNQTLFELESTVDLLQRATHAEGRAPARGDALTIALTYADARAAIAWLKLTFGFESRLVVPAPDGGVRHSELVLGSAVVFVSSAAAKDAPAPDTADRDDHTICVWVADPDAHYRRAVAKGARIVSELRDEHFGARGYMAADLEGRLWSFSDYVPGEHWTKDSAL
jgi:uncharacterized glyoxalase superfamily protein PhnB/quinol monooxygenase YgiN